jgi:subtilase family serine protease
MRYRNLHVRVSVAALALFALCPLSVLSLTPRNVPDGVRLAVDKGRVDPIQEVNLTVVLKMQNRAAFDKVLEELYDPASPIFHQWLTAEDTEKYTATPQQFLTVKNELVQQGFTVLSEDPHRLWIRVHGAVATVEKAFQTELHNFSYNGVDFQAHIRDAQLAGPAGDIVDAVCGLERHTSKPHLKYVVNPVTGKQLVKKPISSKKDLTAFAGSLTDAPLTVSATELWGDGYDAAYYTGLQYGANGKTAAFTPLQLRAHYGLTSLVSSGYDGTGQTIALVEGYGYPEAEADANEAATLFGLPALTSTNFKVVYPQGAPINPNAAADTGWDTEIALDIQSAHSIAPGAKIVVVASAGQDNEDQIDSLNYIINNKIAKTVSSSWENDGEYISGKLEEEAFSDVLAIGVAQGISFQFSSGDGGDDGLGTPMGSVEVPANSPYATAVGGTSVLNNPYGTNQIVTGWGNLYVYLYDNGPDIPWGGYFNGGAGGGQSLYYAKPTWQKSLPGTWRMVPDVSALADPYTGFPIIITYTGKQYGEVYGGTSLASPIFTATWAIADQYKGAALGQAAPAVAALASGDITDVVPPPSSINKYDVSGLIYTYSGGGCCITPYTAAQIFTKAEDYNNEPEDLSLYSQTQFLSAMWDVPGENNRFYLAVSFGTDSSLTVTDGWDNVTGWGEPNGLPFIQGVTGRKTGALLEKK